MARQASPHSGFDTPSSPRNQSAASTTSGQLGAGVAGITATAAPSLISSSVDSRSTVPSIRAGFAGLVSCGLAGRSDVAWPGAALLAGDLHVSGATTVSYLGRILVCRYIGGAGFPAPWVGTHCFGRPCRDRGQQDFQALPRRTLLALQALDAQDHLLRPLDPPERHGEVAGIAGQARPVLALEAVFGRGLEDLGDAVAGDRRPPAQPAHLRPLRPRFLGQAHELRVPRGDRRQVEAVGFRDPPGAVTHPVALAVRAVLVISPASISARLIVFTWLGDRPSASRCIDAEGQTIGRPPLPQSCGWVKRNSQSTAWTSRGDRPSRGAAALNAASNCPGTVTPSGMPAKSSAVRSARSWLGVRRRKPVGPPAKPPPCASRALSFVIAILRSVGIATGKPLPSAETAISA